MIVVRDRLAHEVKRMKTDKIDLGSLTVALEG